MDANELFALFREWKDISNNTEVILTLYGDGSGNIQNWEKYGTISFHVVWSTIEEGCNNIKRRINEMRRDKEDLPLLFSLYKKWCEKENRIDVILELDINNGGRLIFWDAPYYEYESILQWNTIKEGCQKLQELLEEEK